MTIQSLKIFLTVSQTLSYSKAAAQLKISQPVVSRSITALEEELHLMLIDRSVKRSIHLTPQGQRFFEALTNCEDIFQGALKDIAQYMDNQPLVFHIPHGISIPESFLQKIDACRKQTSKAQIIINYTPYSEMKDAVHNGEAVFVPEEFLPELGKCSCLPIKNYPADLCLLFSEQNPKLKGIQHPTEDHLAGLGVFLPKDLPPRVMQRYCESYKKLAGEWSMPQIVDTIESTMLILRTNRCLTICDSWSSHLHRPGYQYITLDSSTTYYIAWSSTLAPHALQELIKTFDI